MDGRSLRGVTALVAAVCGLAACTTSGAGPGPGGASTPPTTAATPIVVPAPSVAEPSTTVEFVTTGLEGGGFQNVVATSSDGSFVVLGADVSGLHRSEDGGTTFEAANVGVPTWGLKVATVAIDPNDPDHILAGGGFQGTHGGIIETTDGGDTWRVLTEAVRFSGNNNPTVDELPETHPRSTGRLLWMARDGMVYAGSFRDGVMASDDGGATWEVIALDGTLVRGMWLDEAADRLWVGTHDQGTIVIDSPGGDPRVTEVDGGPTTVEELAVGPEGVLHVAAGQDGLWTWDETAWTQTWEDGGTWSAIAVGDDGLVVAGAHDSTRGRDAHNGLLRSLDGGDNWEPVSLPWKLDLTVMGTDRHWWLADAQPGFLPGGRGFTPGQLWVPAGRPGTVWLAGRSGAWVSRDRGSTWQLAVGGLGVTSIEAVATSPDGTVIAANTDYRSIVSDDSFSTVRASKVGATAGLDVAAVQTDAGPRFVLSTAERDDNVDGEIWLSTDPEARDWRSLDAGAPMGGRRPVALAAAAADDGIEVIAAVEDSGLWLLDSRGWSRVDDRPMRSLRGAVGADLAWSPGTAALLLDSGSGLYRSLDDGRTWELVAPFDAATRSAERSGFLAWAGGRKDPVYVSLDDRLLVFDDIAGRQPRWSRLMNGPGLGPVLVDPHGGLWLAKRGTSDRGGILKFSCDQGTTWSTMRDSLYTRTAVTPSGLAIDAAGHLYATTVNNGVVRSRSPIDLGALAQECR